MTRTKAPTLDKKESDRLEKAIKQIIEAVEGEIFTIDGTPMLTVKLKDDTYRRKPAVGGQELVFQSIYVGKSNKVLFCFTPADAREWTLAEFDPEALDRDLPLFSPSLSTALGIDSESMSEILKIMRKRIADEEAADAEANERDLKNVYADNPLFGRF